MAVGQELDPLLNKGRIYCNTNDIPCKICGSLHIFLLVNFCNRTQLTQSTCNELKLQRLWICIRLKMHHFHLQTLRTKLGQHTWILWPISTSPGRGRRRGACNHRTHAMGRTNGIEWSPSLLRVMNTLCGFEAHGKDTLHKIKHNDSDNDIQTNLLVAGYGRTYRN